jgi:hypothetical protein
LVRLDTQNQYVFVVDSADEAAPLPPEVEVRRSNARRPAAIAASAGGYRAPGDPWRMDVIRIVSKQ